MTFLRFLAIIVLGLWIGGLVTLGGIVAPTIFSVLQAQDPATGRDLAAAAFGAVFDRFQHASWIACLVIILSLSGRAALGPRPRRFGLRMWIAAAMLSASVASVFIVAPRIARIHASVSGAIANLPDADPQKVEFNRWHRVSTSLMGLTVLAGVGLTWMEMRDGH